MTKITIPLKGYKNRTAVVNTIVHFCSYYWTGYVKYSTSKYKIHIYVENVVVTNERRLELVDELLGLITKYKDDT